MEKSDYESLLESSEPGLQFQSDNVRSPLMAHSSFENSWDDDDTDQLSVQTANESGIDAGSSVQEQRTQEFFSGGLLSDNISKFPSIDKTKLAAYTFLNVLRHGVCSTPNFKSGNSLQLGAVPANESQNDSSDLFASYARFESGFNSTPESAAISSHSGEDRLFGLSETSASEAAKMARLSTVKTAPTNWNWNNELPGDALDALSLTEHRKPTQNCSNLNLQLTAENISSASSASDRMGAIATVSNCSTKTFEVSSIDDVSPCFTFSDKLIERSAIVDPLSKVHSSDSFEQENQFFGGLRKGQLKSRSKDTNLANFSTFSSTSIEENASSAQRSIDSVDEMQENLILSDSSASKATQSVGRSNIEYSQGGTSSLTNASQVSQGEGSQTEREASLKTSDSSISTSSNSSSNITKRRCKITRDCRESGYFPLFPRHLMEKLEVHSQSDFSSQSNETQYFNAVGHSASVSSSNCAELPKSESNLDRTTSYKSIEVTQSLGTAVTEKEENVTVLSEYRNETDTLTESMTNSQLNSTKKFHAEENCQEQSVEKTSTPSTSMAGDETTSASRLSDKINCINVTKRKRTKVRVNMQLPETVPSTSAHEIHSEPASSTSAHEIHSEPASSTSAHEIHSEQPNRTTDKIDSSNVTKRKRNKVARTSMLPAIVESNGNDLPENSMEEVHTKTDAQQFNSGLPSPNLNEMRSGKWRRLLSVYHRHSISMKSAFLLEQTDVVSINNLKVPLPNESNRQILRHSVSFNLSNFTDFNETNDRRAVRRRRTSVVTPIVDGARLTQFDFGSAYKARDTILRKCGQSEPLEFDDIYSESSLRHCRKIGEGVFGEVFMNKTDEGRAIVLKIIPIEGALEVNGEPQKKFSEILSEIVIALQLSSLRNDKDCMTSSFAEVVQVRCVQGRYPNHLIDLWELYRDNYQTENDHPDIFPDDQLYVVFELANGGQDLEAFQFANALQSKSAFQQMALALAIAEKKLQFEHRDLHWGNILLSPTDEKFVNFKLNGDTLQIPSEGVKVTIIDYTLSRMFYEGMVLYNDLSNDEELFTAHGDYQFDIYRLMKDNLANDWQRFEPFNNIVWLHYIVDKLINGARYKNTKSRKHRLAIEDLMVIRDEITNYKSAIDSVTHI